MGNLLCPLSCASSLQGGDDLALPLSKKKADAPLFPRALIAFLLCLCHIVSYADRFNISVAILHMADEYGYSLQKQGHVFASFFWGYMVTQSLGGVLASPSSSVGPKNCLVMACSGWSLITIATPFCADHSFTMLIVARIGLGAAEGLYVPACLSIIAAWFPPQERASVTALGHVGQCLGAVIAMSSAPIAAHNWRLLFYGFGTVGLLWAVLFSILGSDSPAQPVADEEPAPASRPYGSVASAVASGQGEKKTPPDASYLQILSCPAFYAVCAAQTAYNWSWYLSLSWLPRYFVSMHAVEKDAVGSYAMLPYFVAAVACILWARFIDGRLASGQVSLWGARVLSQWMSACGTIVAWTGLVAASSAGILSLQGAVALLTLAVAVQTSGMSGHPANRVDIGGKHNAARVAAASNTFGTVPGIAANILVGILLGDLNGGWNSVFATMIAAQLIGLIMFTTFCQVETIDFSAR
jgi:sugar phosphate permease